MWASPWGDVYKRQIHRPIVGPLVTLRAATDADRDSLVSILSEPEVAEWWVGYTPERVPREFIEDES